ncbi:hypothetical protein [Photobacterium minamisatsumaniensis]|uniref:hypothetical protein n=1 Tax=Photobacterium minamisatsumaniensis TaxID=2910233 RepID=UPI003D0F0B47
MNIQIEEKNWNGVIQLGEKIKGSGTINHHSWCLSSTSSSLILEISDDPAIQPEDLPLVGYGCSGWVFEHAVVFSEKDVMIAINEGFSLFLSNELKYVPSVTCNCLS